MPSGPALNRGKRGGGSGAGCREHAAWLEGEFGSDGAGRQDVRAALATLPDMIGMVLPEGVDFPRADLNAQGHRRCPGAGSRRGGSPCPHVRSHDAAADAIAERGGVEVQQKADREFADPEVGEQLRLVDGEDALY